MRGAGLNLFKADRAPSAAYHLRRIRPRRHCL